MSEYLSRELDPAETPVVQVSKFVVIPKSGQPGKWRLILDLSSPQQYHVEDSIDRRLSSLMYVLVDNAAQTILRMGQLAKVVTECASTSRRQTTAVHEMARRVTNGYGTTVQTSVCTKDIFY